MLHFVPVVQQRLLLRIFSEVNRLNPVRRMDRRAVFTRSPGFTGIKVGAITSHPTPIRVSCQ